MCGLFGHFESSPVTDPMVLNAQCRAAQRALHHRGPDSQGFETWKVSNGQLTLGHTRLSIIDLSSGGHQPMHSYDGRYTLVFNGEIYNYLELSAELKEIGYRFKTDSDFEVLLSAWAEWGYESLIKL